MREPTKQDLLEIYEMMQRIRKFEYKALDLQMRGYIGGSIHLYVGEESIGATVGHLLRKDDYICSTHRGHGHVLGKGIPSKKALAEVLGKADGACLGHGGSMHIADLDLGILGANGIVGGGIPCAMGAGYSIKVRGTDQVSVSYFGDGAANEGSFHESMNMAALYNLPVLFICENNSYGMTVPIAESTREFDIYKRAAGYGMFGEKYDGTKVLDVWKAVDAALDRARDAENDARPSLLEFKTFRHRGHWEGDPHWLYRPENFEEVCKQNDPMVFFEKELMENWGATESELREMEKAMAAEIDEAEQFALASPYPDPAVVLDGLFTE